MSRTGEGYDNAAMKRFFCSLKHEWTKHVRFDGTAATRVSVFKYIESLYITERTHQYLAYLTPSQAA